jgi:hypothetical protein
MTRPIIGGFGDPLTIEQRVITMQSDIKILDDVISAELHRIAQKVGKAPLTDGEKKAGKIGADFQQFKLDWSGFLASGVYTTDSMALRGYELRLRDFDNAWRALPKEVAQPNAGLSQLPSSPPGYFDNIPSESQTTALYVGGGILAGLALWSVFGRRR